MRFVLQLLFTAAFATLLNMFLPWWSIALAGAIGGYLLNSKAGFFAGFIGIGIVWYVASVWIDIQAATELGNQVTSLFPADKTTLTILASSLAGLVGGFASMTGSSLRKSSRKNSNPYRI